MRGSKGGAYFLIANSIGICCRKSSLMFSEPLPFMNEILLLVFFSTIAIRRKANFCSILSLREVDILSNSSGFFLAA